MQVFTKRFLSANALLLMLAASGSLANTLPTLEIQNKVIGVGDTLNMVVAPTDADGVVPGVAMLSGPSGATLTDNGDGTRQLRWQAETTGEHAVIFSVFDGQDPTLLNLYTMDISVIGKNINQDTVPPQSISPSSFIEPEQNAVPQQLTAVAPHAPATNNLKTINEPVYAAALDARLPEYLVNSKEPEIDTHIVRVTDRSLFKFTQNSATHRYSKRQAWNSNETLVEIDHKILDANTYSVLHEYIPLSSERAWSNHDPFTMIGITHDTRLAYHNFATNSTTVVATFDQYERCTLGDGEGNPSNDDSKVLIVCIGNNTSNISAYSVQLPSGKVIGTAKLESDYNWAGFSQSGEYVLVEYAVMGRGNFRLIKYSPDLNTHSLFLNHDVGHGDFGIDNEGNDVYVMIDHTGLYYKRLNDDTAVHIGSSSDGSGLGFGHVSCRNIKITGWCFYSSTNRNSIGKFKLGIDKNMPTKLVNGNTWLTGIREIEEWGDARSSSSRYDSQPKVSASPSGRQLIYSSDWFGQTDVHSFISTKQY